MTKGELFASAAFVGWAFACTPTAHSKSATPESSSASTLEVSPVPTATSSHADSSPPVSASAPAPQSSDAVDGTACKRDLDCVQEPDLHPCCGPEGRTVPSEMNCAVKSVDCRLLRTCVGGSCVGPRRACKKREDCPPLGYVHPCCSGNAPKEMNCALKKVNCSGQRACTGGFCSPPRRER